MPESRFNQGAIFFKRFQASADAAHSRVILLKKRFEKTLPVPT